MNWTPSKPLTVRVIRRAGEIVVIPIAPSVTPGGEGGETNG